MKKAITILSLVLASSTAFAAGNGKIVDCTASVSGNGIRGEDEVNSKSAILDVSNDQMQTGSVVLQITPTKKQKIDLELYRAEGGLALDLITNIKGTEIKVYGKQDTVQLEMREKNLVTIFCAVQ